MSALERFLSTWSKARQTFGDGVPQTGAQFDQSAALRQMQCTVETAAPGPRWTGPAANAYGAVNTGHAQLFDKLAALDTRLAGHINESARVVTRGRQNLDTLRQWVIDAAAAVPPGKDRDRLLLPIVSKGFSDLTGIINDSNTELNRVAAKISGLGSEWDALVRLPSPSARELISHPPGADT